MMNPLTVTAHIADEMLYLNYRVANMSSQVLYLFNILPRPDRRGGEYSAGSAYTSAWPPNAVLFLQGWTPLPQEAYLTAPACPGATRLRPHQTAEFTLRFPLPLREWHCYATVPDDHTPAQEVEIERAALLIDTLSAAHQFEEAEVYPNLPDVWWVNGHPIERLQAEFKLPRPCPLQVRLDGFVRFPLAFTP